MALLRVNGLHNISLHSFLSLLVNWVWESTIKIWSLAKHRKCSKNKCSNKCSKNFRKFHRKMSVPRYLFSKVADIQLATLLKKRFQHMCFTGSFAKFLERFFYRTPLCDCFCHETFIKDETHKFFSSNHLNIQTFVSIFLYLARIIGKQALLR